MVNGGILIGKRYEVLSKIGEGGMADVYKGRDKMLNRYVAIKVLKKEYREDQNFVRKFRSEAQAAAGLMHPNIVNVYDVGEDRGLYYMVMELVEGITLKEYIRRKGRLARKELISIAIQMCTGIGAAHAAHIIHRDIKPQNIIISKEGKVKVTDFGIAKATTSNTISSNAMGSVHYSSPEQVRGGFSDAKSDIYSIGITLYEMATGELPFDGDSTVAVAMKHIQDDIMPPSEIVPDIPYSLEQIILKCTQKEGVRRYSSTDELIRDLKHLLVDPEGDFVVIPPLNSADTVLISDEDLDDLRDHTYDEDDEYYEDEEDDDYGEDDDDYEEYEEERPAKKRSSKKGKKSSDVDPRMKKIMKIMTAVVAVLIVFIVIFAMGKAFGIFKSAGRGTAAEESTNSVTVPDLRGMTEEQAKAALKEKGLGIKVDSREESKKYEEGRICEQNPGADEKVERNTTVHVVVSSKLVGEEVVVPDVSGMDEEKAQSVLEKAGLKVGTSVFEYSDDVEEGVVISTTPEADSKTTKDQEVVMKVSKGSEKVEVPDVVGKEDSKAQSALKKAGLSVTATYQYDDKVANGKVVFQSKEAGSKVASGTTINIVVSNGPKPEDKISVPDMSGQTLSGARALLESKGLKCVDGGQEYSDTIATGKVTSWSPSGKVKKGSSVTVWISCGPEGSDDPDDDVYDEPID